jgi:hypothetical protein
MTLEQYIQNLNAAYKNGLLLNGISAFDLEKLKDSIVSDSAADEAADVGREPTLSLEVVKQITRKFGLRFVSENRIGNLCFASNNEELRDEYVQDFSPSDILDYLYAVLHGSKYRKENNESLKRIPFPTCLSGFRTLILLGRQLRQIQYQEIVVASVDAERLKKEIDKVEIEWIGIKI